MEKSLSTPGIYTHIHHALWALTRTFLIGRRLEFRSLWSAVHKMFLNHLILNSIIFSVKVTDRLNSWSQCIFFFERGQRRSNDLTSKVPRRTCRSYLWVREDWTAWSRTSDTVRCTGTGAGPFSLNGKWEREEMGGGKTSHEWWFFFT